MALRAKGKADTQQDCAKRALSKMESLGVPPEVENYTVWFTYFRGTHPALNERLDADMASGNAFTDALNREIFDTFFADDRSKDTVRDATARIFEVIRDLLTGFSETGQRTDAYASTLERLHEQVSGANMQELARLLGELRVETNMVIEHNRSIGVQFDDASREIVELQDRVDAATRQADVDELTGLANWRSFHARLRDYAVAALESNAPMTVVMLDLDDFGAFNSRNGRWVGDQQLRFVADVLSRLAPEPSVAARYGGEEFAVILPAAGLVDAVNFAEAIRHEVGSGQLVAPKTGQKFGVVTLSAGVSEYRGGETLGDLIQRCTRLLEEAKSSGRDRVVADPAPVAKAG